MAEHRWSGWPGAWCLDCGADDPRELAVADGRIWFEDNPADPERPFVRYEQGFEKLLAGLMVCPEPGSKRHDPYARADERAAAERALNHDARDGTS